MDGGQERIVAVKLPLACVSGADKQVEVDGCS